MSKRFDQDGRDVSDLPGLWCESDRIELDIVDLLGDVEDSPTSALPWDDLEDPDDPDWPGPPERECSMCGADDEPMQQCEVCGLWMCNNCVISRGLSTRLCAACAKGDGLDDEFPF